MKRFIRSFWFTIRYHHHRITNRSQNLFGSNLLVDRLSGDQGRVLREICLSYLKRKKKKIKKKKDSNRLEIGACLKQTKIDVKSALLLIATSFFSLSCFYHYYTLRKPTTYNLDKDNHEATSTRIKRQTMP